MKKPNFLIIGAMKAGTTTLYEDLRLMPEIYLTPDKEPDGLANWDGKSASTLTSYWRKFSAARHQQWIGEASTSYSKRPTYLDIPAKARSALGRELRLIYIVRDPIDRAISHYQHEVLAGREQREPSVAITPTSEYIQFGRPDYQLAPWYSEFEDKNFLLLCFHHYIKDRETVLHKIRQFLGLPPLKQVRLAPRRNASFGKLILPTGTFRRRIFASQIYLFRIKPFLPTVIRDAGKRVLSERARSTPAVDPSLVIDAAHAGLSSSDWNLLHLLRSD